MAFASLTTKAKLILIITFACSITILITITAVIFTSISSIKKDLHDQLESMSKIMIENITPSLIFNDSDSANSMLLSFKDNDQIVLSCLYDKDNNLFSKYSVSGYNCPFNKSDYDKILRNKFFVKKEVFNKSENIGYLLIVVQPTTLNYFIRHQIITAVVVFFITLLLIAYPLALILQSFVSKPIYDLVGYTVKNSQSFNFKDNVAVSKDEIALLKMIFTGLFNNLNESYKEINHSRYVREKQINNSNILLEYIKYEIDDILSSGQVYNELLKNEAGGKINDKYVKTFNILFENSKRIPVTLNETKSIFISNFNNLNNHHQETNLNPIVRDSFLIVFEKLAFVDFYTNIRHDAYILTNESILKNLFETIFLFFNRILKDSEKHIVSITSEENKIIKIAFYKINKTIIIDESEASLITTNIDVRHIIYKIKLLANSINFNLSIGLRSEEISFILNLNCDHIINNDNFLRFKNAESR